MQNLVHPLSASRSPHPGIEQVNEENGSPQLKRRLAEIQTDTWIDPVTRQPTVDQLFAALIADYRNNGMAVLEGTEQRWEKRLKEHFGGRKAVSITTEYLNRYVT